MGVIVARIYKIPLNAIWNLNNIKAILTKRDKLIAMILNRS
jgi:hypothetical protein